MQMCLLLNLSKDQVLSMGLVLFYSDMMNCPHPCKRQVGSPTNSSGDLRTLDRYQIIYMMLITKL
jgi:hypothetical protein